MASVVACNGMKNQPPRLKIVSIDTPGEQKLILHGRITEPWISELNSHWEEARRRHPERKFVVDLQGVTRIDSVGERMLELILRKGAEFVAD